MKRLIGVLSLFFLVVPFLVFASSQITAEDLITGRYVDPEESSNAFVYGTIAVVVTVAGCFILKRIRKGAGETEKWK